jgi:hypothetical protein
MARQSAEAVATTTGAIIAIRIGNQQQQQQQQ